MEGENKLLKDELKKDKKSKKKYWIIVLIFLGIFGAVVTAYVINPDLVEKINFFKNNETTNPTQNPNPNGGEVMTFPEYICSSIKVTPTWANEMGIIDEGYTNFNNTPSRDVTDLLIQQGIYLVYQEGCGACDAQIEYFGTEWERYVNSGYTINCNQVFK